MGGLLLLAMKHVREKSSSGIEANKRHAVLGCSWRTSGEVAAKNLFPLLVPRQDGDSTLKHLKSNKSWHLLHNSKG